MTNVTITINNGAGTNVRKYANVLPDRLKRGLYKAGLVFERDAKKKLSGPSHSKNPGNSNPHPGAVTGTLRRSVTTAGSATEVVVGPGGLATPYAAIHEFGGRAGRGGSAVLPARPYMQPALDDKHEDAFAVFEREITADV